MTPKLLTLLVIASALGGAVFGGVSAVVVTATPVREPLVRVLSKIFPSLALPATSVAETPKSKIPTESLAPLEPTVTDEETLVADVVEKTLPSVVSIVGVEKRPVGDVEVETDSGLSVTPIIPPNEVQTGSGFVVADGSFIVTNKHVVSREGLDYDVVTYEGRRLKAEVVARDPFVDLAVVKLKDGKRLKPLSLGDSDHLRIGQTVIVIGNSLSQYRNSVTKGVISGFGRRIVAGDGVMSEVIEGAIQTDAAINVGNSGGPLLNLRGEVIGVNTAINREGSALGFSIPVREARRVVESVRKYGRIVRPWLGVRYLTLSEKLSLQENLSVSQGALVIESDEAGSVAVLPGSPADKAGIKSRDIIIQVGSVVLSEEIPLGAAVTRFKPGDKVKIKIIRNGKTITLTVTLEEYKNE